MFEILSMMITHPQFSKNNLRLQLEREYGVDVDNVDVGVDPPTEEETEWAGKLMLALVSPYGEFETPTVEEVELAKKSLLSVRWKSTGKIQMSLDYLVLPYISYFNLHMWEFA